MSASDWLATSISAAAAAATLVAVTYARLTVRESQAARREERLDREVRRLERLAGTLLEVAHNIETGGVHVARVDLPRIRFSLALLDCEVAGLRACRQVASSAIAQGEADNVAARERQRGAG